MAPPVASTVAVPPPLTLQVLDTAVPILRLAQSVSAVSFSIFSVIHLSAPLSALLPSRPRYISSPENRANGFLLIGRELYQGEWSEPILVFGSLAVHVVSGVANRGLRVWQTIERRRWRRAQLRSEVNALACADEDDDARPGTERLAAMKEGEKNLLVDELDETDAAQVVIQVTSPEGEAQDPFNLDEQELLEARPSTAATGSISVVPRLTSHQATGYALVPIVLHHLYVHRILPSSRLAPISSLSPSFFNYSFTALALNHESVYLRVASTVSYAALASVATYHALVGLRILSDPTAPRSLAPKRSKAGQPSKRRKVTKGREWQAVWTAVVVGVGVGTARIAGRLGGERIASGSNPAWIAKRMDYVLKKGWAVA
ncbi:hypothetical protein JCM3766R1_004626 [Sporobolomyces carnicolor]